MDPDRQPLGPRVFGAAPLVGAGDARRAPPRQGRETRAHHLVPPAADARPRLGAERSRREEVRPLLQHGVRQNPLATRHRSELAEPPISRDELVRRRASAWPALRTKGEPPGLRRHAARADTRELDALGEDLARGLHVRAGPLHLLERTLGVARLDFDALDRVLHDGDVESLAPRIQDGVLHAVVSGEAGDEDVVDSTLAEEVAETRVLEAGIPLAVGILPLVDHDVDLRPLEPSMELGARGSL